MHRAKLAFTSDLDLALSLISAATLAPSSHNTQPWLFVVGKRRIDVIADRRRALPVNDPEDRELTISCACALFNLRVAAAAAGYAPRVTLCPEPGNEDLLARVELAHADLPHVDAGLRAAIGMRRTTRERFGPEAVGQPAIQALAAAADREGAALRVLATEAQRHEAADLVAQGDALQWGNPSWRRELGAWMHPRREGDGLSLPAFAVPIAQAIVRTFDMGQGIAARDRQLADESPLLTVLATRGDSVKDWLVAGQALQRMLLTGVAFGLQASYLNQPVQIGALRRRLEQSAGCEGVAQVLVRWGTPLRDLSPSPRRPLADVVEPF